MKASEMTNEERDSACAKCAKERGCMMKNKVVGIWMGVCDFCGEIKPLTSLSHDWARSKILARMAGSKR